MINLIRGSICCFTIVMLPAFGQQTISRTKLAPYSTELTPDRIDLGRYLYFEKRLSKDNSVSCQSCHDILSNSNKLASGADNIALSRGIGGLNGQRNAPTVWNAALRSKLFWDGRASSLEQQAAGPITNSVEMSESPVNIERKLSAIPKYVKMFKKAFASKNPTDIITFEKVTLALSAFERTLITPHSRFDRFIEGDTSILSSSEKKGWELFRNFSCNACHGEPTFSNGERYIRFPALNVKPFTTKYNFLEDIGRMNATKEDKDRNRWRVPSLRNVALTSPYFHNGAVKTLEEAVEIMGRVQLGKTFSQDEINYLVAFLKTLTGEMPRITDPF